MRLDPRAVQWREVQGEVVAVDFHNSRYLTINPSAYVLWPLLDRGATVDELTLALTERWSLDAERARMDVEHFLDWLGQAKLLLTDGD